MADALHHSFVELAAERDTLRRFVADASHELRTPMTALRTFNELLQGPAQGDTNAQSEFLAESHTRIARLEWITRNLLDLSRWDGGMATLALAEVEVGELVAAAVTPFRALAQEREIELTVVLPEAPVLATIDGPRLGMAVGNLLDNALKFTPAGERVEVGMAQDGEGIKIWVLDTGMGIGMDDLPHIFARFYRSARVTQAGSGLGLAIVERIVHAHDARIEVESAEGVGSCFTVHWGQETVKRALEVACAGGHNVLLKGPPGAGKTLLARALPSILPRLTLDEALDVTRIYSVADALPSDQPLILTCPFRAPHHTISHAGGWWAVATGPVLGRSASLIGAFYFLTNCQSLVRAIWRRCANPWKIAW